MTARRLPRWATKVRVQAAALFLAVAALAGTGWNVIELQQDLNRGCLTDRHARLVNREQNQVLRVLFEERLTSRNLTAASRAAFRRAIAGLGPIDQDQADTHC